MIGSQFPGNSESFSAAPCDNLPLNGFRCVVLVAGTSVRRAGKCVERDTETHTFSCFSRLAEEAAEDNDAPLTA